MRFIIRQRRHENSAVAFFRYHWQSWGKEVLAGVAFYVVVVFWWTKF